jgi:hypothetical protein
LAPFLLAAAGALLVTGCPNPNTYGTPRTVRPGKLSHSIAAEWVGWSFKERVEDPETGEVLQEAEVSGSIIAPPTYTLRLGVADTVDVGFRAANLSSLGADVKWNFAKSEFFDAAIDPGAQWLNVGFDVVHLHAPVLIGFNFSEAVSLVLSPGVMYGVSSFDTGEDDLDNELNELLGADGLYGRLGVGFDFRFTKRFAVHPEVTFLRSFSQDDDTQLEGALTYMFGIGFNFGNLPDFAVDAEQPAQSSTP